MNSTRIRVLVSSTERKRNGGSRAYTFAEAQEERALNRFPSLSGGRDKVLRAFLPAVNGQGHAKEVLRLDGEALRIASETNHAFPKSPLLIVARREHGPFFTALGIGEDDPCWRRVREDLVVVCPLLGLLSPSDLVPDYRCPVGAQIPGFGSLHTFWKPRVSPVLNRICHGRRVFSFLSGRLAALWAGYRGALDIVQILFVRLTRDGRTLPENAGSGRPAGELVRRLFTEDITEREAVFEHRFSTGHQFAPELSDLQARHARVVFARPVGLRAANR